MTYNDGRRNQSWTSRIYYLMGVVVTVRKLWPTEGKGKGKVWGLGSTEGIRYVKVRALCAYRAQGVRCALSPSALWPLAL